LRGLGQGRRFRKGWMTREARLRQEAHNRHDEYHGKCYESNLEKLLDLHLSSL
jgi:hypothetical protein